MDWIVAAGAFVLALAIMVIIGRLRRKDDGLPDPYETWRGDDPGLPWRGDR